MVLEDCMAEVLRASRRRSNWFSRSMLQMLFVISVVVVLRLSVMASMCPDLYIYIVDLRSRS